MYAIYLEVAPHNYVLVEVSAEKNIIKANTRANELSLETPGRYLVEPLKDAPETISDNPEKAS